MMALAIDRSRTGPAVVAGLGCHLSPAVAVKKALIEVCQIADSVRGRQDARGSWLLPVARALATGLQPIHFGHREERLGRRRLFEVPARMGYGSGPRTEDDLNPCPHPLP